MPKLPQDIKSEFLRSDMVEHGHIIKIVSEAKPVEREFSGQKRTVWEAQIVTPDGTVCIWTLNKTTLRNLSKAWTDDTANWVGKLAKIAKVKQNVRGVLKDVLYGHPITDEKLTEFQVPV